MRRLVWCGFVALATLVVLAVIFLPHWNHRCACPSKRAVVAVTNCDTTPTDGGGQTYFCDPRGR
jgi:hypothetical protein